MAGSIEDRFIEIGRIGRPRGLEGVVRFMPNQDFTDDLLDRTDLFYMKNERSDLIPYRVESVYTETKQNQQTFFVKFDSIANRTDAEAAQDKALFIKKEVIEETEDQIDELLTLIGFTVQYDEKEFGEVLDVLENPAHPILEVKHGKGALLIPMVDEYVEKTDPEKGIVFCRNLDQLTGE